MSSTTQQMQQARPEQVQSRAEGIRSQLDRIEQQVRFDQQTSGYPQQPSQQASQQRADQLAELIQLRERTSAFAQEVRDKADRIVQHLATESQNSSPQMGFGPTNSQTQTWVAPLIQVIREQLELTTQVVQQVQANQKS